MCCLFRITNLDAHTVSRKCKRTIGILLIARAIGHLTICNIERKGRCRNQIGFAVIHKLLAGFFQRITRAISQPLKGHRLGCLGLPKQRTGCRDCELALVQGICRCVLDISQCVIGYAFLCKGNAFRRCQFEQRTAQFGFACEIILCNRMQWCIFECNLNKVTVGDGQCILDQVFHVILAAHITPSIGVAGAHCTKCLLTINLNRIILCVCDFLLNLQDSVIRGRTSDCNRNAHHVFNRIKRLCGCNGLPPTICTVNRECIPYARFAVGIVQNHGVDGNGSVQVCPVIVPCHLSIGNGRFYFILISPGSIRVHFDACTGFYLKIILYDKILLLIFETAVIAGGHFGFHEIVDAGSNEIALFEVIRQGCGFEVCILGQPRAAIEVFPCIQQRVSRAAFQRSGCIQ